MLKTMCNRYSRDAEIQAVWKRFEAEGIFNHGINSILRLCDPAFNVAPQTVRAHQAYLQKKQSFSAFALCRPYNLLFSSQIVISAHIVNKSVMTIYGVAARVRTSA